MTKYTFVVFLIGAVLAQAQVPYNGTECIGVLPFNLSSSATATDLASAETLVQGTLAQQAVWAQEPCAQAMRKAICMMAYFQLAASYPTLYCTDTCFSDLTPCHSYFKLVELAKAGWTTACDSLPTNSAFGPLCVSGNEPAQYAADIPVCPLPLVMYEEKDKDYENGVVFDIHGSQCAVPCPTLVYSGDLMHREQRVALGLSVSSTILAGITTVSYAMTGKWLVVNFAAGNMLNSFFQMITIARNYEDFGYICKGERRQIYNSHDPWCEFQGFAATFFIVWIATWASIMAFHLFLTVFVVRQGLMEQNLKYYLAVGWSIPWICMLPSLGRDRFGYDFELVVPICLIIQHDNDSEFWFAMFLPWMIGVVLCTAFQVSASVKLLVSYGSLGARAAAHRDEDNERIKIWRKALWYNRRTSIFVITFGVWSFITGVNALYVLYFNKPKYRDGLRELVGCLLENATDDPTYARTICGELIYGPPPFWTAAEIDVFWAAYGFVPFLVYGTGGKLNDWFSATVKRRMPVMSETIMRRTSAIIRRALGPDETSDSVDRGQSVSIAMTNKP